MFSRYGHVGLVGGWVIRITEMPEIIYSLGTQVPPVLGQDSFTSLLGTDLRDTQTPEAFVSSRAYTGGNGRAPAM